MARDLHHRRPLRQHRDRRRRQRREVTGGVHHFAINHRQHRLNAFDLLFRDAEVVFRQHHQIGKLTGGQTAFLALLAGEPGAARRPQLQRDIARQAVGVVIHRHPANGAPGDQPVQRGPRVIAGDAGRIGAQPHRHVQRQHLCYRRGMFHRLFAVAIDKIFALEGHPMLHRNTAPQRLHPLNVTLGNGLGMIEEPVQAIKRDIAVHLLKHVQHPADGLIVGGMQAERPAMLHQMAYHPLQLILHALRQIRPRLQEIFKIRRRKYQHLAGAVGAIEVSPLPRLQHVGPAFKILQLLLRPLSKQVVGDAHGHLIFRVQLFDNFVIFRIVLEAAAGVDGAGQPQSVQLAHKLTGGVHLQIQRQLRPLGQRSVKDHGVRFGDQHPGRVAVAIADDLAARRIRRLFGISHGFQRRTVQQRAIVEMEHKHRRIRRRLVQLFQGRHPPFSELKFAPAADHPHPLRGRRAIRLILQHSKGIRQRGDALPAELKVVVQPTADQVQVRIVEARDHRMPFEIDDLRPLGGKAHDPIVTSGGNNFSVGDGHGFRQGIRTIEGMNLTVGQNQCGSLRHNALLEEADSVFLQPASKQAGHDGHPEPDHQRNHAGIIDQVQQQAPLKRRQQHAGHRRHQVGAGENHQQGDQKLFPAPRLAYVHRRRGKPEGRFSPHLSPIAFRQQWGNLSHQLPTGFRLRPGVEVLQGIEADYDAPQILPCGGPDHIRPKMAGKFCRNGHNFTEPLFVALAVLRIEQMADNQGHRFLLRHDEFLASGKWPVFSCHSP